MNRNRPYLKFISQFIIALGAFIIIMVAAIEVYSYPWGTVFPSQKNHTDLPDPSPIVLKGEDANSILLESPGDKSNISMENVELDSTLPGNTKENSYLPSYLKLGVIKIPKIKLAQHVLEGTDRQLDYGVGHIIGTADFGAEGNCVLTGHNSSSFRYLKKLAVNDLIYLETGSDTYTYSVYDSFIVEPDETWVLDNIKNEESALTLITCTSYALETNRLIVRARLVAINDTELITN